MLMSGGLTRCIYEFEYPRYRRPARECPEFHWSALYYHWALPRQTNPIPFPVPEPDQKDLFEEGPDRHRYLLDAVRTD